LDHPVQTLEVVVIPARYRIGDHGNIELSLVFAVEETGIPGRNVVFTQVMLQPGFRPVRIDQCAGIVSWAILDDFITQAAQHPEFWGFDCEFPAGIVESYLQILFVGTVQKTFHVGYHFIYHRVVDIGIYVGFVMNIDPVGAGMQCTRNKCIAGICVEVVSA